MKLASLRSGRNGRLMVVDKALERAAFAPVATMQDALDDWANAEPQLRTLANALEHGSVESFPFDPAACAAPLPRAYQWLDGSAYVNHVDLVRRSRGEQLPQWYWTEPLMYQGGSDVLLGPRDPIRIPDAEWGIDFEGELAVILGDVPAGADQDTTAAAIRLIVVANDVSLRNLIPSELGKGFGFVQSKPATAFSPVAITPDELGEAWDESRVSLRLRTEINGAAFGVLETGPEMTFDFPALIRHAAKTRALCAGTILGSGTVSNRGDHDSPGRPVADGGRGYACISEQRMVEVILTGSAKTPFLRSGDRLRIELLGNDNSSILGAIDQVLLLENQPALP